MVQRGRNRGRRDQKWVRRREERRGAMLLPARVLSVHAHVDV